MEPSPSTKTNSCRLAGWLIVERREILPLYYTLAAHTQRGMARINRGT